MACTFNLFIHVSTLILAVVAAKLSDDNSSELERLSLRDVTPFSLGKAVRGEVMSVVVPKNTKLPNCITKRFQTVYDQQTSVAIKVKTKY